jgi:SAM-dependent MidA family methyltransferase
MVAMAEVGLAEQVTIEEPGPDGALPPITGVVLANEVADAFPVHRLVWRTSPASGLGLRERYVTWGGDGFTDEEGELSAAALAADPLGRLAAAGVRLAEGDVIEISPGAANWFAGVARGLERGYTLVIDYGYEAAELYRGHRLAGTLRAYAQHTVTDDPFQEVGERDLTAHVDFTALRAAGEAAGLTFGGFTTQGAFLASLGLGDLLVRLQAEPGMTANDYLAAQQAVLRLIDPGGMGRFGVQMMARGAPVAPLQGLTMAAPGF